MRTRDEHLAWCKQRALEYLDTGRPNALATLRDAFVSMISDLRKHPDTEHHSGIQLGMMLLVAGHLKTTKEMRDFIEGFR